MRKVFRTIFALAVAALALSACKKDLQEVPATHGIKIDFVAQSLETKTEFGTPSGSSIPVLWQAGDKVVTVFDTYKGDEATVEPSADFTSARFSTSIPDKATSPYSAFALYPASSFVSSSSNSTYGKYIMFAIPISQKPTENTIDPEAQVLLATTTFEEVPEDPVPLTFKHLAAYGKMTLNNLDTNGKDVEAITISFGDIGIAGRCVYQEADGTVINNNPSNAITLETSSVKNLVFSVFPVDVSGATLTVSAAVEGGNYVHSVTLPDNKVFKTGVISSFSVDMSAAKFETAKVYSLVSDISTLKVSDEIIIASTNADNSCLAISTTQNTSNRQSIDITSALKDDTIVNPASTVEVITLEAGSTDGTFLFKTTAGEYLFCPGSAKNNYLRTTNVGTSTTLTTLEEAQEKHSADWAIVTDQATATGIRIVNQSTATFDAGKGPRIYLELNVDKFSCYPKDSFLPVSIYRLEGSETPPEPEKVLTVERLWGKYGSEAGPWYSYFTSSENCSRSIAMDDNYIFMPETQANPVLWKIPVDGTTAPSLMPVGTVDGGGTFALCCARIIPNVKEAVNSGKDYVLGMTNLAINQDTYFYYYRNGIDHDPVKVLIRTSGTNRRLGDKFTWNGTINEGKIWLNDAYDSNDQGAVITAYMKWTDIQEDGWPARITMFKEGPSASGIVAAGYAYPDYSDPLNVTSNVLYTSANNACLVSDIATNSSTVDEFSGNGWYKNAAGFQFFEFEGKKYIAYAKMETTTQSRLIIIEDLGSGAQFKQTLHAHNVVFQAPIQHESNFDFESPTPSVHGCVDCSVRIINGEPYIAVMHQNVGLSLFKMSMK